MSHLAIVIIGRNEGARLIKCLESVSKVDGLVVYVDSGSTDRSVDAAHEAGADVIELDMSIPFTAARARNRGLERALSLDPSTRYVQFIDGDCEMNPHWFGAAQEALDRESSIAAVAGRLRERFPQESVFNRLCDMEWATPVGVVPSCGGIAMMRVEAVRAVGGFNQTIIAGEEPELCSRLRASGWTIHRIDREMGWHDASMHRFGQWWRRQVRSAYGAVDVACRFGVMQFRRQVRSALIWTVGWSLLLLITGLALGMYSSQAVAVAGIALVLLLLPFQALRLARRVRRKGMTWPDALTYGSLTLLSKWASLVGQYRYIRDRCTGRLSAAIAYKVQ